MGEKRLKEKVIDVLMARIIDNNKKEVQVRNICIFFSMKHN